MKATVEKPGRFQVGIDTLQVLRLLEAANVGEIVTYAKLREALGYDPRSKRGPITTALRKVLQESNKVFASVTNVGYRRLSDTEVVQSAPSDVESIHKRTRRAQRKLIAVEFDSLARTEQVRHNTMASVLGALAQATKPKTVARIEAKVSSDNKRIDIGETLKLFGA